jgi:glycosyltransferase involved in cell wall biosynthesis
LLSLMIKRKLLLDHEVASAVPRARGAKVLYLSYDGMCDPLGGSQVLPYLTGLAKLGHQITLVSFEKPERSADERAAIARLCADAGISWHPLSYHKRPPLLSSMYDVRRMRHLGARLHRDRHFDLIHCRSDLPALVGLAMKRRCGAPFVFDMRGFWADERVEGGLWNLSNPLFRAVYRYFKRREAEFLAKADHIVSLTEEGKRILLERNAVRAPITVIPCCVDFDVFPPVQASDRAAARRLLGIPAEAKVAAYLGSVGSWYMAGEMLDFLRVQLKRNPSAMFLIVTREPAAEIVALAETRGIAAEHLIVRPASRAEVPKLLAAADYGLFFIKPVFSKKASSPTKMGEFLSLELPIVTNGNVGDVERIVGETGAGVVVGDFTEDSYGAALDALERLGPDMVRWRAAARRWFDLDTGVERYDAIYASVMGPARG